jgi:hypothetical protein
MFIPILHKNSTFLCTRFSFFCAQDFHFFVHKISTFLCTRFSFFCAQDFHFFVHKIFIFLCTRIPLFFVHKNFIFLCTRFSFFCAQEFHFFVHKIFTFLCTRIITSLAGFPFLVNQWNVWYHYLTNSKHHKTSEKTYPNSDTLETLTSEN